MSRSEVNERINDLLQQSLNIKHGSNPNSPENKVALELLENWRKDLQSIYYQHLYKLP